MATISIINQAGETIQTNEVVNSPTLSNLANGSTTSNMTLEAGKAYNVQVGLSDGVINVAIFDA
ncbi:MAG: hypothetical protein HEP71_31635 [Roseivirga sp.]|nr:hypothetical protein [Roseivirga sp.]